MIESPAAKPQDGKNAMNDDVNKTPVCTGACLFGKCPHKVCIKHLQREKKAVQLKANMNILTTGLMPDITSDKTGYGVAVDIGTTTVVMYLYDCGTMQQLGCLSRLNAQATIGVDVISRIKYCSEYEDGLSILNEAIVTLINQLLNEITDNVTNKDDISHIVLTGNTTMLHLLAKISPVTMGVSPFTPASLFGDIRDAAQLGLDLKGAKAYLVPCISAFVGGDITSAILASGMFGSDSFCALLDIGTNGEVAVGSKNGIFATSTAAGPAFEGAQISCGMAGVNGAINSVFALKGELKITTIGEKEPVGICGSGLLDALALMLDVGLVDETGRIVDKADINDSLKIYLTEIDGESAVKVFGDIALTQKDIREVQTAKAAIAAGLKSLLHHAQKDMNDVETIYLAGGFGNYMDEESAIRIGLLPREASGRIKTIGNAAGAGAIMALLNDGYMENNTQIAKAGEHVELGHNPYFMDQYIEDMFFPKQ